MTEATRTGGDKFTFAYYNASRASRTVSYTIESRLEDGDELRMTIYFPKDYTGRDIDTRLNLVLTKPTEATDKKQWEHDTLRSGGSGIRSEQPITLDDAIKQHVSPVLGCREQVRKDVYMALDNLCYSNEKYGFYPDNA
ncbi:uncharacterized protein I303_107611 [Kwoniella dejecticola CBS 10117]|uniref:Uncharacterized protein n=1 Tax=Kwoniella dejecticola CBS 10117 TaxID=1296121 RepID=A0A1A5ZV78_9TREE|nr:uncharacterized protein I303_07622 [Kwoniella dejecticola CBS 10117]OBR81712.1 hypothetical protein I303_07622 [Kwoniella dejecticola CBS 10117]